MNFRNSSFYVQRQINRVFRSYKYYAKAYVDDIVIFSKIKHEHIAHLKSIFNILIENNIIVNSFKVYIEISSITLLEQRVTFLRLSTDEKKLKVILNLIFFQTFEELDI